MQVHYLGYVADAYVENGKAHLHIINCGDSLHATFEEGGEAEAALRELVDDYLTTCAEVGKSPALKTTP